MKLDDLFGNAPLLEPPGALKTKVMESIGKDSSSGENAPGRTGVVIRYFFTKRAAISFAAVAAALLLAVRIFPGVYVTTGPEQVAELTAPKAEAPDDKINEFVEEALSQVFGAGPGVDVAHDDESMDIDMYISSQFEEIFWINGGNNA